MGVFETYAKRKRFRAKAGKADVYQYDEIPPFLRTQVIYVLVASLGRWYNSGPYDSDYVPSGNRNWEPISNTLEREMPAFPNRAVGDPMARCLGLIGSTQDVDDWLSVIEICCKVLDVMRQDNAQISMRQCDAQQPADDALEEINTRFRESGFGYQYGLFAEKGG